MFPWQGKYVVMFQRLFHVTDAKNEQIMRIDKITLLEWITWMNGSSTGIWPSIVRMHLVGDVVILMLHENVLRKILGLDGQNYCDCHTSILSSSLPSTQCIAYF